MYNYPIAIEPATEGRSFGVHFPGVPGCHSAGDTLDEALENARQALEGHFECLVEDGGQIPMPGPIEQLQDYPGHIWATVSIDPLPFFGKSRKINVTMPGFLISKVDRAVKAHPQYRDRSRFLQIAALRLADEAGS